MKNLCIVIVNVGLVLLALGGCASKTTTTTIKSPPLQSIDENRNDSSQMEAGMHSEPAITPSNATLSMLNGNQLGTVYFDYDSFTLNSTAMQALEQNAAWLLDHQTIRVTIEGHCDERGSDEYNLALGERRALAVKNYLTARGIAGERLATVSYGEEKPVHSGHDEIAWAKNRRAEFK